MSLFKRTRKASDTVPIDPASTDSQPGLLQRIRNGLPRLTTIVTRLKDIQRSKGLVAFCFFLAVYTDCSTINLVQSLAPAVLKKFYYTRDCNCSGSFKNYNSGTAVHTPVIPPNNHPAKHLIGGKEYPAYFCQERTRYDCITEPEIMTRNAMMVGALASIGPLVELVLTPLVKFLCLKFGYQFFLLGAGILQFGGSWLFMFAKEHSHLMIARGGFQGTVSTIVCIAGPLMVAETFGESGKMKVLGLVYAMAHPLSAMTISPPGNGGFQLVGPYIPFGIAAALGFVSLLIILTVLTGERFKGHGDQEHYEELHDEVLDCVSAFWKYHDHKGKSHGRSSSIEVQQEALHEIGDESSSNGNSDDETSYQTKRGKHALAKDSYAVAKATNNTTPKQAKGSTEALTSFHHTKSYGTYEENKSDITDGHHSKIPNSNEIVVPINDKSKKVTAGKWCGNWVILSDKYVLVVLVTSFFECVAVSCIAATSPNWLINVALAEQYQVGVVFGLCGVVQLILNLTVGMIVTKGRLWFVLFACIPLLAAALFIYPNLSSVWWALIPEMFYRSAAGIIFGITSKMLSIHLSKEYRAESNVVGMACFAAVTTSGYACGALTGGILIFYDVTLINIYLPLGVFMIGCTVGPYYMVEYNV
ncbi:uncharacterized protein LOC135498581 [Lineus longissimus]|uniref:uncharacterized protein LOC135498581 n=1 Tax=Lineus longissimus TaxID=88925 RepID=UPI002B4FA4D3